MSTGNDAARPRAVNPLSAIALAIVATLGVLYIVSQFLRNSVGVIAPNLAVRDRALADRARTSLQHLFLRLRGDADAARRGARPLRAEALHAGLRRPSRCWAACCSPLAQATGSLVIARALLGFGTASFLMAPFALYARWFPPERFSTLAGIQLGLGSLGALLATAPLAFATASVGWRVTFLGVGV